MSADPSWSVGTHTNVQAAAAGVDALAERFVADGDDDAAAAARDAGAVLIGCVAAVCSAIADLAAALRDRPA